VNLEISEFNKEYDEYEQSTVEISTLASGNIHENARKIKFTMISELTDVKS